MSLLAKFPQAERDGPRDSWGSVVLPLTASVMLQDTGRLFRFEQLQPYNEATLSMAGTDWGSAEADAGALPVDLRGACFQYVSFYVGVCLLLRGEKKMKASLEILQLVQ